jgi:glucokinase
VLENDANAAALAEWHAGRDAGSEARHLVYLTMSTGVGAGLVLDGRVHGGRADLAGEVGHAPVVHDGVECPCGLRGCLEAYIGGAAWSRRLRASLPDASRMLALAGERARVSPEHVVLAAREGDAEALAEMAQFNQMLARAIVPLVFTLSPDVVALGTIARAAGDGLCIGPVRRLVEERLWPQLADGLEIRAALLGDELPYRAGLCVAASG